MLLPSILLDSVTVTTTVTIDYDLAPPALVAPAPAPAPMPSPRRDHPVVLGVATGPAIGFDTHDHCKNVGCVGAGFDLGIALRPHLYAMAMASVLDSPERPGSSTHHAETVGVRLYSGNAWAQLGVGIGTGKHAYWIDGYMYGGGLEATALAAIGLDPIIRDTYRLGVQARASTADDPEHTLVASVLLGMTWY